MSWRALAWAIGVVCLLLVGARTAHAEPDPASDDLAKAKELFQQGNELRNAGDCERALERFAASRALVPSVPNILNSAYCLNSLGRADEALDDYALLLTDFEKDLQPEEIEQLGQAMAALREKLGGIQVVANVADATLIVDGKPRGKLPRVTPVRVLPGEHRIMVLKEGYQSTDATAHVDVGRVSEVKATLTPLAIAGRVRIDAAELTGADIVIDGAPIARAPWEGVLAKGVHWYALSRGDQGSPPSRLVVVDGQTAVVSATLRPLGPVVDVVTSPAEARLTVGDVDVGVGRFRARLPRGSVELSARAEGYVTTRQSVVVGESSPRAVTLRLPIDADHPRWRVNAKPLHWFLELGGGPGFGSGFASDAERSCDGKAVCTHESIVIGGQVELRGGLRLPSGLSFALGVGYLGARKSLSRRIDTRFASTDVRYDYDDRLSTFGPFAALGIGFTLPVGIVEPRASLFGGVLYASSRDDIAVSASAGQTRADARVENAGRPTHGADVFVRPELGVGLRAGPLRFGIDVGASVFLLSGPRNEHGNTIVAGSEGCAASPGSVVCAPFQTEVAQERIYRTFVMVSPTASVGYVF